MFLTFLHAHHNNDSSVDMVVVGATIALAPALTVRFLFPKHGPIWFNATELLIVMSRRLKKKNVDAGHSAYLVARAVFVLIEN